MKERLIIHIVSTGGDLIWFLQDESGSSSVYTAESLAEKSWDNYKGEVIVFVPTPDVYLTKAKLPELSKNKLRKAIPYAIEDEITEDLMQCQFAIADPDSTGHTAIAVVNQAVIKAWLELIPFPLTGHISAMVPDIFGLPWSLGRWAVVEMGDQVLVRMGMLEGFSIEKDNAVEVLAQYIQDNNHAVEEILLITSPSHQNLEEKLVDNLKILVKVQALESSFSEFLLRNFDQKCSLNLLQGDFESDYSTRGIPKLRKIFVSLAAVWVILLSLFGFAKLGFLTYQSHRLNAEIAAIYNEVFPGESSKVSPKERIEVALAAVQKAKKQSVFLRLVAVASPILVNTKGVSVQSANFSNGQLDVQIEASDFQLLDKVTTSLRAAGIAAEQSRATKAGNVIQSHLIIKEA